eukprot:2926797-Amphidinium_carterae.1
MELRRISALVYKKNKRYKQSIELSKASHGDSAHKTGCARDFYLTQQTPLRNRLTTETGLHLTRRRYPLLSLLCSGACQGDKMFRDAMETARDSGNQDLAE